ncbi:aldo/keto reductase [Maritimibacter dapengensis]|uniref:Aldo/keto reductase n=1 Tax=Maritimibacter dapengensis TaxID=2836868 RepID=A0ABS6T0K7_9RHOB|nr:aldo/keto reductase [Maritimibacter dapengensis]MBV7378772.1 aldo/keto reductase [Maritimibacter dapengensis]
MRMNTLAGGALTVSELCLGSMTWGTQNTEAEGHAQMDMALDHGVNFIDTAEMYPTNPLTSERVGNTEKIIGTWLAGRGKRDDVVIASKVTGPSPTVREEGYSGAIIRQTVEDSLTRLQTDYIDIYQLHWPQRGSYHFRQYWKYDPSSQDPAKTVDELRDVMEALTDLVAQGKIRHFGVSNDTAWGVAKFQQLAEEAGGPRVISIQNEYSLLCRIFDLDLAELCVQEDVKLLAYSPLAAGILTGKYHGGTKVPEGSRMSIVSNLGGRVTDRLWPATQAYLDIAEKHGLDPVHLALAFCTSRPFMGSAIFGATSLDQLERALGAQDMTLSDEVLGEIATAHKAHPMPF